MIIVAASGWVYWIMISKFASAAEIGQATMVFSLITTIAVLTQLGLEYPLLKKPSVTNKSRILGTTLAIELVISVFSIPFIVYTMNHAYGESLAGYDLITIVMLFLYQIGFVSRSLLLGIPDVKKVFFIDVVAVCIRFLTGIILVILGFGSFGIILSFLLQYLVVAAFMLVIVSGVFSLKVGNFQYAKKIIKDGLVNTPAKLSRLFIISSCVVLLGSFGVNDSEVGVFYLALMISVMGGGFASSIAYMSIPVSHMSKIDLSSGSLRIGVSLTAPIIVAFIVAPKEILALIGEEYLSAELTFVILSLSILPYSIVMNAISKFNNMLKSKELITIGSVQVLAFFLTFLFLVPHHGSVGAALAFLIGFVISAILSLFWSEKYLVKYVLVSVLAITAGWLVGIFFNFVGEIHILLTIFVSMSVTSIVVLLLKNISVSELKQLILGIIKRQSI
jgi:O-antigen/teichoic acid export membrane protein